MAAFVDDDKTRQEEKMALNSDIVKMNPASNHPSNYKDELDEGAGFDSGNDVITCENYNTSNQRHFKIIACIAISALILSLFSAIGVIYLLLNQNYMHCTNTITSPVSSTDVTQNYTTNTTPNPSSPYTYKNHVGDYKISAQNNSHSNWLLCDGSFIDPNVYPELFNTIGYSFGSQISGTVKQFALPNIMDRVIGIHGNRHDFGDKIGKDNITLGINNIPSHSHLMVHNGACSNTHGYSQSQPYLTSDCGLFAEGLYAFSLTTTSSLPDAVPTSNIGNGESFELYQPTLFVGNLFIYAGDLDLE